MSTAPFANEFHLRTVHETSSQPCWVCYKPTTRVLITPNKKDFFYTCEGHLTDRGFASPVVDAGEEAAKVKKAAMDRAIEQVTQEYEEKQRRMKEKGKKAKKDGDDDEEKGKKKKEDEEEEDDAKAKKERDDKIKSLKSGDAASESDEIPLPRIYKLHSTLYKQRLDRMRTIEIAKRTRQRVDEPSFFPSVPKGDPQ